MATERHKEYIGDGVYVSFDGFSICIETGRDNGLHYIHMERSELQSLVNYAAKCGLVVKPQS